MLTAANALVIMTKAPQPGRSKTRLVPPLSYDEAAVVLDCPVGTIRSRVSRARVELADEVAAAEAC